MIFGNAAWGLRETPLEKQLEITSDMGLENLEIGIANAPMDIPVDISDDELLKIKKTAEKYNVRLICAATGNDFTVGDSDVSKVRKVIDICRKLSVSYLRIFAGFTPLENVSGDAFNKMIESLINVSEYAKENNVVPVIETHGGVNGFPDGVEHVPSVTTDLDTLKKIISLLPDNVGICFDPANLYAVGVERPEKFFAEIKDRVAYSHFKDFRRLPSGHLEPSYCGASDMNWKEIVKAMADFDGVCLFEYENTSDITEGLKKSYDYIKNINY